MTRPLAVAAVLAALGACGGKDRVTVVRSSFGQLPDGRAGEAFTLTNPAGIVVQAITYCGMITVIRTPARSGPPCDIVTCFDDLAGSLGAPHYFGALVGRYANRIAGGQ